MARKVCHLLCSNSFFVQAKKLVEEATREKDNMVMKYAVAEQKNIELAEKMETVEERMREMTKERENVISKFKVLKTDRDKAALAFESRVRNMLGYHILIYDCQADTSQQNVIPNI